MSPYVLIVYYSRNGSVAKLANLIGRGVESVDGIEARIRTLPPVSFEKGEGPDEEIMIPKVKADDNRGERPAKANPDRPPFATYKDLEGCSGLALGSPTRFGNMAAPVKYYIDGALELWMNGGLIGKPASVFTATASMHGGQESSLLSMMNPLLHLGMLIVGLPYSEPALTTTTTGGTPYGPSHVSGPKHENQISEDEQQLAMAMGKRLGTLALQLER